MASAPAIDYATPGPLTGLDGIADELIGVAADDPVEICRPVRSLVIQPSDPIVAGLGEKRIAENQIRPARLLVARLLELDPAPVTRPREPERRVVGTCRHFAVLACALLRHHGVASRARCGFATYFQPGQALDHWVVELRDSDRWRRLDPEVLGTEVIANADDLQPGDFLTGGEAWSAFRRGEVDASLFGVHGTENFGPSEIRGNLVRDLACLTKVETLPWDEWGRMTDAYDGRTGPAYDALLDEVAAVCAADDAAAIARVYSRDELRVPEALWSPPVHTRHRRTRT